MNNGKVIFKNYRRENYALHLKKDIVFPRIITSTDLEVSHICCSLDRVSLQSLSSLQWSRQTVSNDLGIFSRWLDRVYPVYKCTVG